MSERCSWCGAALDDRPHRFGAGIRLCGGCGAYNTSPQPSDAELGTAYSTWYRPQAGRFGSVLDRLLRQARTQLARRVDELAPPGRVLDVGAGDGSLVDALVARRRDALGIERVANGERVQALELHQVDGEYAAVVFWHSLEHLRAPGDAVRQALALLKPGGVVFVAVPNAGSLQARVFGSRWFALDLPRHLVHLPAATLVAGLEAAGLKVGRVSHWRGGQVLFGWVHGLAGLLPGAPSLYDAIRIAEARENPMSVRRRVGTLFVAGLLSPVALACTVVEVALRRGGTVYIEAKRG
ncbi:MAG: hypothetical protein QOJ29_4647 [Thermoleophilaceae bacterium]|jgi:SAM-dependent methyltransferase|nr:hypothetical protein [Thermoleophilaceae bacterium]